MGQVAALAAFTVLAFGLVGCGAAKKPVPDEPPAQAARRVAPQRPVAQAAGQAAVPPENPWFPPQDWSQRRDAEDFAIGALESGVAGQAAYRKLDEVCRALVQGKVETSALDPARAAGVAETLSAQIEAGGAPTGYRIGRLERSSDVAAWARVRFTGDRGSSEGEAHLVLLDQGWFVSDFQIDLSTQRPGAAGTFLPSPYRERVQ